MHIAAFPGERATWPNGRFGDIRPWPVGRARLARPTPAIPRVANSRADNGIRPEQRQIP